ncbi:NOL1/NOP2/sun family putative RNA methylase [Natranaerovirga pectinivora]|uniref:NOL1/NOP2/sun family putative RNA methylase n=1 Tax=Natranaerovirga pectinivora TaxID=682400 RepID=A0A4R3MS18_9FIRM|nr:RsmB/NOP family class I SAM-dependent RNA methyltransferase [Natranaerovirga pectinivora]TCT17008.1 NOL1/NOP2/sun family putative RNA methylase [Natranaerovirga pectinivora]
MKLPDKYEARMEALLKEEYQAYIESFNKDRYYGIRINTLKIQPDVFKKITKLKIKEIPWAYNGFYYDKDQQPAKHPYYFAGLYYVQEPSAMTPANFLPIEEGDKVLDLCAAPGGKSTELGAKLNGTGLLISNDISHTRAKALLKNIELSGITNSIITSEPSENLLNHFPEYFDKILVDAPCSGEGMFRKDPNMIKSWENQGVEYYSAIQKDIIIQAGKMLKPNGLMLYSTCTFSPEENEEIIEHLLKEYPEFTIEKLPMVEGFDIGKPEWVDGSEELKKCVRLWPHKIQGEGHFLALLKKQGNSNGIEKEGYKYSAKKKEYIELEEFINENLSIELDYNRIEVIQEKVYYLPKDMPNVKGLRLLRTGWYLGEIKKKRFEPSQAFAMGLTSSEAKSTINFSINQDEVLRYLKGETLQVESSKGWKLVCVDDYPLGWGKINNNVLKNKYYSGWRWM